MGEEEELGLWCDPFDPCGYLVIIIIYVFMMAFWLNDKRINHKMYGVRLLELKVQTLKQIRQVLCHLLSERAKSLAEGKRKSRAKSKRRAGPVIVSEEESDQDGK